MARQDRAMPRVAGQAGRRRGSAGRGDEWTAAMRLLLRFFGFLFAAGTIVFLVGVGAAAGLLWHFSKDLPDYSQLQDYEPPVMTRVHAGDGSLLAEYANAAPALHADPGGAEAGDQRLPRRRGQELLRAQRPRLRRHRPRRHALHRRTTARGRRPQGASTITQQVAKNFLLTNEVSLQRKIKEALLALKIERTYSKEKILELYLNEIYLGLGAYGVAAASLLYFDKSVHELTIAGGGLSRRAAEGAEQLQSVPPARPRDRAAQLRASTRWRGPATSRRPTPRRPRRSRSTSPCGRPARTSSPPNISPKRCAARSTRSTARRSCTRAACRCAPRSTRSCRCWRARR